MTGFLFQGETSMAEKTLATTGKGRTRRNNIPWLGNPAVMAESGLESPAQSGYNRRLDDGIPGPWHWQVPARHDVCNVDVYDPTAPKD
jgi:hypothetical protein